jgi:hypothetical protein
VEPATSLLQLDQILPVLDLLEQIAAFRDLPLGERLEDTMALEQASNLGQRRPQVLSRLADAI